MSGNSGALPPSEDRALSPSATEPLRVSSPVGVTIPSADLEICMIETAWRALRILGTAGRRRGLAYLSERLCVEAEPMHPRSIQRVPLAEEEVVGAVAQAAGFTLAEIVGASRRAPLVRARSAAALALQRLGVSSPATGRVLGGRDHSTVLHALKNAQAEWGKSPHFRRLVEIGVAQGMKARRAETANAGSVEDDSPVPEGNAP